MNVFRITSARCGAAMRTPHQWLMTKSLLWLSPASVVRGFEIRSLNVFLSAEHLNALEDALGLIASVDPTRYTRLKRDVHRIMLVRTGGAEYWPLADGFILTSSYVKEAMPEALALDIVHEAVHARLFSMGIGYHPALRERIEHLAVRQDTLFASKLPNGERLAQQVREKLSRPWWTQAAIKARQHRARLSSNCP